LGQKNKFLEKNGINKLEKKLYNEGYDMIYKNNEQKENKHKSISRNTKYKIKIVKIK